MSPAKTVSSATGALPRKKRLTSLLQLAKAQPPIFVTLFGMVTEVRCAQELNAFFAMVTTLLGTM